MPCGVGAQLIRSGPQRLAIYELLTPTAGAAGRSPRLLMHNPYGFGPVTALKSVSSTAPQ